MENKTFTYEGQRSFIRVVIPTLTDLLYMYFDFMILCVFNIHCFILKKNQKR